jgi:hypothetical protein
MSKSDGKQGTSTPPGNHIGPGTVLGGAVVASTGPATPVMLGYSEALAQTGMGLPMLDVKRLTTSPVNGVQMYTTACSVFEVLRNTSFDKTTGQLQRLSPEMLEACVTAFTAHPCFPDHPGYDFAERLSIVTGGHELMLPPPQRNARRRAKSGYIGLCRSEFHTHRGIGGGDARIVDGVCDECAKTEADYYQNTWYDLHEIKALVIQPLAMLIEGMCERQWLRSVYELVVLNPDGANITQLWRVAGLQGNRFWMSAMQASRAITALTPPKRPGSVKQIAAMFGREDALAICLYGKQILKGGRYTHEIGRQSGVMASLGWCIVDKTRFVLGDVKTCAYITTWYRPTNATQPVLWTAFEDEIYLVSRDYLDVMRRVIMHEVSVSIIFDDGAAVPAADTNASITHDGSMLVATRAELVTWSDLAVALRGHGDTTRVLQLNCSPRSEYEIVEIPTGLARGHAVLELLQRKHECPAMFQNIHTEVDTSCGDHSRRTLLSMDALRMFAGLTPRSRAQLAQAGQS